MRLEKPVGTRLTPEFDAKVRHMARKAKMPLSLWLRNFIEKHLPKEKRAS